jgi:hypothetical protein
MDLFEVRENKFGKSVYSNSVIRKGSPIFSFSGQPMQYNETKEMGEKESFALQVGLQLYIFLDEPACYFNHSCEPNCGLRELELMALREIAPDEELTYDYSTTMLERDWNLKCSCGKKTCRKVVTDFDRLPADLQKRYVQLDVVQPFILEKLPTLKKF